MLITRPCNLLVWYLIVPLQEWVEEMEKLPGMQTYLNERPKLVGIGVDPGLEDKNGYFLSQRDPDGRAILVDGAFEF